MVKKMGLTVAMGMVLVSSAPAWALDCVDYELRGSLPARDAVDQPVNAQVVVQTYSFFAEGLSVVLLDGVTGAAVSVSETTSHFGTSGQWRLIPTAPLSPGQDYHVEIRDTEGTLRDTISFATGSAQDDTPPTAPSVLSAESSQETDTWGDWNTWSLALSPATDAHGVLYELELSPNEDFSGSFIRIGLDEAPFLRDTPCETDEVATWDAETTWIRVRAIDVAGNASDSTTAEPPGPSDTGTPTEEEEEEESGKSEEGGCATLGGTASSAGLLGLVGLVGLLARRRRRSLG